MHLSAGKAYGRDATCRNKVNYLSEETATDSAVSMSVRYNKKYGVIPLLLVRGMAYRPDNDGR